MKFPDSFDEWCKSFLTRSAVEHLEKVELPNRMNALEVACTKSVDPGVVRAFEALSTVKQMIRAMKGAPNGGHENG